MECTKCKLQCVGKTEMEFKLNKQPSQRCCNSSRSTFRRKRYHDFHTDAKFTIIDHLQNIRLSKEIITELLKKRKNIWIRKLETLRPKGLNHKLN